MTTLEIVLMIELVLLATIAIVLLIALLQRDRQDQRGGWNSYLSPQVTRIYDLYEPDLRGNDQTFRPGRAEWRDHPRAVNARRSATGGYPSESMTYRSPAHRSASKTDHRVHSGPAPMRQVKKTVITPGVGDHNAAFMNQAAPSERTSHDSPRWRVGFMEMSSGRRVSRDFRDHLIVGRIMNSTMNSGRLYLSMDATVSRSQFCLYVTDKGIMLENLSNVNITRKNGHPVWQPVLLEEGDILQLGRMQYMVKEIRPAA